ncbi:hypothetical protein EVAR_36248_1 [Eumeta japonica]|uniref:Uncharacterized protein n=1 Tax=Eumeta variegata TaxID=151549 RepID=A0A4C1WZR3_EUMVA|nr:hypothetical protein EVAR_36248_1 [Eumeta japonica]
MRVMEKVGKGRPRKFYADHIADTGIFKSSTPIALYSDTAGPKMFAARARPSPAALSFHVHGLNVPHRPTD